MPPVGGVMATLPEFESWVMTNMEPLVREGRKFYQSIFTEVCRALFRSATVSIIPESDVLGTMEPLIAEFFSISQARWETRVRNRCLFDGVQVLIGDYPVPPRSINQ